MKTDFKKQLIKAYDKDAKRRNSAYAGIDRNKGWGNLFLAYFPKFLSDVDELKERMEKMVNKIRN